MTKKNYQEMMLRLDGMEELREACLYMQMSMKALSMNIMELA